MLGTILKNRGTISEGIGGLVTTGKRDWRRRSLLKKITSMDYD
jgi:hypothetical protein